MTVVRGSIERCRELLQVNLVGVGLGCVRTRVAHERLQRYEVSPTFAKEAIGKAVSQLVRGKGTNTGPLADALHHPPQRLLTRWLLGSFRLRSRLC